MDNLGGDRLENASPWESLELSCRRHGDALWPCAPDILFTRPPAPYTRFVPTQTVKPSPSSNSSSSSSLRNIQKTKYVAAFRVRRKATRLRSPAEAEVTGAMAPGRMKRLPFSASIALMLGWLDLRSPASPACPSSALPRPLGVMCQWSGFCPADSVHPLLAGSCSSGPGQCGVDVSLVFGTSDVI